MKKNIYVGIKVLIVVGLFSVMSGCTRSDLQQQKVGFYDFVPDIRYKPEGSDYERERCRLDLYLPEDISNFPVLVWFHGGALKVGDKSEDHASAVGKRFVRDNIGVVLVNYRLNPQVKYPAYVDDAACAVAWTVANIGRFRGNPDRIFVGGHSAGAYLTVMIALDDQYLGRYGLSPRSISGIIPVSGQMNSHSTVREERDIPVTQVVIDESAPVFFVGNEAPPCLLFCAEKDTQDFIDQNQRFHDALRSAGNGDVAFFIAPSRDHMGLVMKINEEDDIISSRTIEFINRIVSPEIK
jgi:acetyl esterase/lipase